MPEDLPSAPPHSAPDVAGGSRSAPVNTSMLTRWGSRGTALVLGIGSLVLLLLGATLGLALGNSTGSAAAPLGADGKDVVNTGFARDMVVHHTQGVVLAHVAELNSTDKEVRLVAYDIEYTQTSEIGSMQGWLDLWGVPRLTSLPPMQWMSGGGAGGMAGMNMGGSPAATSAAGAADGAIMPGMATNAEITKLIGLKGETSDTFFLQLMIRHHMGGAAMMRDAANHAASPVPRNFASKMLAAQQSEIGVMTGMLTARGAKPLPYAGPTG